ncbi:Transmembrane matrix receptor MUP-4 [Parelaphostrongylus tenuis]|uniref:Transmembrane matrix receptor MUP-4 n=1 Tax=Parelaphostrongylus tenuis TaxID=148309 RepID=A0AAD5RGR9_PARTN|nr:Transmembrane matrix receptor MUP-4 [Parelaphostrongylus tenuis]
MEPWRGVIRNVRLNEFHLGYKFQTAFSNINRAKGRQVMGRTMAHEWFTKCVFFSNGQYRCECPTGINRLPDGRCLSVDECARPSLNTCHKDAKCIDKENGYTCECNPGFADVSTDRVNKPGRICKKTDNECGQRKTYGVDCDPNAACVDTPEGYQCVCQPGYVDISSSVSRLPGGRSALPYNTKTV